MMRLAPGGPFDSERRLPPEIEHNIEAAYDLDKPLYEQYFIYLAGSRTAISARRYKNKDFTVTAADRGRACRSARSLGISAIAHRHSRSARCSASLAALQPEHGQPTIRVMAVAMIGITHPDLRHRAAADADLRRLRLQPVRADFTLPVGGWNGGAFAQHDPAGDRAGAAADRHHRAAGARQHDRSAALQFCPHRARQGPARPSRGHRAMRCAPGCCRWSAISARRSPAS